MRKLPWAALGLLAAAAMANVVFVGCGSEDDNPIVEGADGGDENANTSETGPGLDSGTDGFITTIDGSRADAADCKLVAQTCASSGDCCSLNCNTTTKQCEPPLNKCSPSGTACITGNECCTLSCVGSTCSTKLCVADNGACAVDGECCGGKCAPDGKGGGICTPLNPGGPKTDGNPCATNTDCASKLCSGGICVSSSFCGQNGEQCAADTDCCGGACTKAAGSTLGTCGLTKASGAGGCDPAGTTCTSSGAACGQPCCSRSCAPYAATKVSVCQPASGCHLTGDLCRADSDCCGWSGSPDPKMGVVTCRKDVSTQEFGLCDKGQGCTEPGTLCGQVGGVAVCSASNSCCDPVGKPSNYCQSNPSNCCAFDNLGVPRCLVAPRDCATAVITTATVCATSADCCGKPCIDNKCGTTCVPSGGACSASADCCAGLPCAITPGSTKGVCGGTLAPDGGVVPPPADGGVVITQDGGTAGDGGVCALYGQGCTMTSDCCNPNSGVQCLGTAGAMSCRFP
jgi:hypothetical protein